jgi:hypothetical protein
VPITLNHERDNIYRLDIRGMLLKADFDLCQNALAAEIDRIGPVKLLIILDRFEGWERTAAWNDLTFYASHGGNIERIAIVGHERWRDHALMFAAVDLRSAPVQFFSLHMLPEARDWLFADVV